VERFALALQASILLRSSPAGELFCRTRLAGAHGLMFGTLPAGVPAMPVIDRALPG
jgi:putative acyl-CoA dehydrogenase